MNILIAPNSFKECAGSVSAASLILKSLKKNISLEKQDKLNFLVSPLTDGGDGFLDVLAEIFPLKMLKFEITAPWGKGKILTEVGYSAEQKRVFVESAKILGLNLIPPGKRDPKILSSIGLGEVLIKLKTLKEKGRLDFRDVLIGIGGTGTNDLAMGALQKLGLETVDEKGENIEPLPANFLRLEKIRKQPEPLPFEIKLVVDVNNPLLGEKGATRVYGYQKGIKEKEINLFEKGFEKILSIAGFKEERRKELNGAGGGLAAGFRIFYNSPIVSAKEFIKNVIGINSEKISPHLIITGEGKLDEQTLMGKGVGVIIEEFPETKKIIICGVNDLKEGVANSEIIELGQFFDSIPESISRFEEGIERAIKGIVKIYFN